MVLVSSYIVLASFSFGFFVYKRLGSKILCHCLALILNEAYPTHTPSDKHSIVYSKQTWIQISSDTYEVSGIGQVIYP